MKAFIFNPKREHAYPLRGKGKVRAFKDTTIDVKQHQWGLDKQFGRYRTVQRVAVKVFGTLGRGPRIYEAKISFTFPLLILEEKTVKGGMS